MAPDLNVVQPRALEEPEQREITRLCVESAQLLMMHGAESALVESLARRLGLALGVERVEVAVMANAIVLTTLSERHCITTTRRSEDRGINMHVVTEVQRAMLQVEAGALDAGAYRQQLAAIRPLRYPRWLVSVLIGASCACFARLSHADLVGCGLVFVASGVAMYFRLALARVHFSPLVNFFATAFVATSITGLGALYHLGSTPKAAIATCVLLLVPGFPLINGVSDMVKGYANTGVARLTWATALSAAACGGILLAMACWDLWAVAAPATAPVATGLLLGFVQNAALASVPAVGFGMSFNVPRRVLLWCAAGGALGRGLRFLLQEGAGMPVGWATLLGAAAVSWLGVYAAQRLRAHPKVFTVAAMIPMVPGVPIFTTLVALAEIQRNGFTSELFSTALTNGLRSGFIVGALAVGLAIPGLFVYRRKPVV